MPSFFTHEETKTYLLLLWQMRRSDQSSTPTTHDVRNHIHRSYIFFPCHFNFRFVRIQYESVTYWIPTYGFPESLWTRKLASQRPFFLNTLRSKLLLIVSTPIIIIISLFVGSLSTRSEEGTQAPEEENRDTDDTIARSRSQAAAAESSSCRRLSSVGSWRESRYHRQLSQTKNHQRMPR